MKEKLLFQLMLAMMTIMAVTSASAQDCISGTVYNDLDLDCVQDPEETGIPGVTMVLINSTGVVVEQITNDTGFYLFCGLVAGDYVLLTQTGSPNLEPNPATQTVTVPVGQSIVDVDVCITDLSLLGTIAGSAFIDLNSNGLRDIFEPCLVDFPVTLADGMGGTVTINTDAQGMFRFNRLPSDDYTVSMEADIPNTEWVSGPSFSVSLTPGQIINNVRFVRRPLLGFGSIIDVICFDLNADGLNDPATEPPLGGIPVQLLNLQGQVLATSISDSKGVYSFIGIPAGEYRVQALFNPEDYIPTTPTTYDVNLPVNEFRRPGPFYGQPRRKIFKCGMAVSTFGSEAHGDQVVSVKDIRDRSGAPAVSSGTPWSPLDLSSLNWKDSNLGEIFGIAIDVDFNVYLTAATIPTYSASFVVNNNEPLIYRIDPFTGSIFDLTFETNGATTVGNSAINTGTSGLGNICSDGGDLLFVTNMSDGTIVVVGDASHPNPGDVLQVYSVTSFPAVSMAVRHLWGIAYNKIESRLYFSGPPSGGAVRIYSIPVSGGVISGAEFLEFTVAGINFNDIADIAFSQDGTKMLLAERGNPHQARVLQYAGSSGSWSAPQEIFVGGYWQGRNAAGGVDYAHESFSGDMPPFVECEPFLATSGNALNYPSPAIYGYGITPASGNLQPGANFPPNAADFTGLNSILIDNDINTIQADKSYQGDVEVFDCACPTDDGCDELFDLLVTPTMSIDGHCCLILDYENNGSETVYGVELVGLDGVTFNNGYVPGPGLFTPNFGASNVTFVPTGFVPMPAITNLVADLCVENINATPQYILVNYLDSAYQTFCTDTIPVFCEPEQTCLYIVSDTLVCDSLGYKYSATVTNPAGANFSVGFIKFNITPPITGVTYLPNPPEFILSTPLNPGDTTMVMFWIQTNQDLYGGDSLCFILSAHDGPEERLCCAEIDTCIAFPLCDPCPYVDADIIPLSDVQAVECCYELIITDTFTLDPALFQSVQTTILTPGVTFSGLVTLPALLDGWSVTHLVPNMDLLWTHNSGMVPDDIGYNLFDFCVQGTTSTDSIYIAVNWLGADSLVICTDTLAIYCPFCLTVINDTLTCRTNADGTTDYVYTFQVQNFSPFPVNTIGIVEIPSGNTGISPEFISIPTIPAFPPGGTSIPVSIVIDGAAGPINDFCFDLVLRQVILDSIDITCCYATHCIDLPPCDSLSDFRCPDPALVSNLPCTLEFLPVCGCDGVTYSNICHAGNAGVTLWTPGVCDTMLLLQDPRLNLRAALAQSNAVQLDWTLMAEQGFDFFALERLYEGGASKVIATQRFDGVQVKYEYLDTEATPGLNRYRVAASNSRGVPIYSNVAAIFVQEITGDDLALRTYPVPASQQLFVASSKSGICDISIVSPDGRSLQARQFNLTGAPVPLDISALPAGAYSVRLRYGDGVVAQQRFVKVD